MTLNSIAAKRTLAAIFMLAAMLFVLPLTAFADATAQFYIPNSAVPQGSQFTVSVEFTADRNIGTVQAQISYDETAIEFISSDFGNGGGGLVNLMGFPDSASNTMMVSMTFRALTPGSSQLDLISGSVMSPDGVMLSNSINAYASVTVSAADENADRKSDESTASDSGDSEDERTPSHPDSRNVASAQLKSITLSDGQLVPEFSPDVYNYTVTLPHNIDYLSIDAETADPNAGIWFEGSEYLADGIVPRTITVTSPDGSTVNVYTISVTRLSDGESEAAENSDDDEFVIPGDEAYTDSEIEAITTLSTKTPLTPDRPKSDKTGVEELRDKLMVPLIVAMAVIILAIVILVVWVRMKSRNRLK